MHVNLSNLEKRMCIQLVCGHHVSLNSTSTLSGIDLYRDVCVRQKI